MYQNKKILATICARGGSKGLPGKNIKKLAGQELLAYSIKSARESKLIDEIVLSTDDLKIKKVAEKYGLKVPFLRPTKLATDQSGRVEAIVHAVKKIESIKNEDYEVIVDLGNVSPLRTAQDIDACIKKLVDTPQTNIVVSVCEAGRNPYFNMLEVNTSNYANLIKKSNFKRRQDAPIIYDMNDAVFAIWKKALLKYQSFVIPRRRVYVMPRERSIDIDNEFDFKIAEFLIRQLAKK